MGLRHLYSQTASFVRWSLRWRERRTRPRSYIRDYYPRFADYKASRSYTSIAILDLLLHEGATNIAEIGVFRAVKARCLLEGLMARFPADQVTYAGFDLFMQAEDAEEVAPDEAPFSKDEVSRLLSDMGVKHRLYGGLTSESLPLYVEDLKKGQATLPDFLLIDGGHSYQTCTNDFTYAAAIAELNPHLIVVFDDFHLPGVRQTVSEIDKSRYVVTDILGAPVVFEKEARGLSSLIEVRRRDR